MPAAQAVSALALSVSGFILGMAFDLYRVLRRLSSPGKWLTIACDSLFWLVYTVWTFVLLLRVNAGEVRFYVFLSIALGFGVYFWLFSRQMISGWYAVLYRLVLAGQWLFGWLNRLIDLVVRIVLWPYRVAERLILRPVYTILCWLFRPLRWLHGWLSRVVAGWWLRLTAPLRRPLRRLRQLLAELIAPPTKSS